MSSELTDHGGGEGCIRIPRKRKTNHFPCTLRVRIAREAMERLRAVADRAGTSVSRVIRELVSHAS